MLYSTQVAGATGYHFEVRTGGGFPSGTVVGEYPGLANYIYEFNLNLPAPITFNTTYWIRVSTYQVNGEWVYGDTCMITTPPPPLSSVASPTPCGTTITNTWTTIYAAQVNNVYGISATQYRFNASVGGTAFGTPFVTTNSSCSLHSFGPPITTNTAYTITVDIFWANDWRNGTATCVLTTGNTITRRSENEIAVFDVTAYPNPFSNNFKIDINTSYEDSIEVKVFDMLGRAIENRVSSITDLDSQEIGEGYTSGVYIVIVKQGDNIKTLRMMKR